MADANFWGVEVKAGQPVKCEPGFGRYLHISQAALGEVKADKASDAVPIFVKVGDQKLVLGTLSSEKFPQISFDLVFERDFELSHNWKHGSVYFCGYYSSGFEEPEGFTDSESEDEDEEVPLLVSENGKSEIKEEKAKPAVNKAIASKSESADAKPKVKIAEPKKATDEDDDEDESDDDDSEEDDSDDDDEDMAEAGDESDDDEEDDDSDDESSEEDKATPKKVEKGKKRPAESAEKTPAEKKAKLVTPTGQKSGGDAKKNVHTATPHPAKKAAKTAGNDNKSKPQTPKSGGQFACGSCSKTFNSDMALNSHTKAKHSAGK